LLDAVAALHEHGGAEAQVLALADGPLLEKASALGASTLVIPPPPHLARLGESGVGSHAAAALLPLLSATPAVARFLTEVRRAIASARPDVVHTNGMKAHLLGGLTAPRRTRLVIHLHDFTGTRPISKLLLPTLATIRPRTAFIAISGAVARDFERISPRAHVHTVYNVVDTDYFREGAAEPDWLASTAGLQPPTPPTVSFGLVATYARWKGHSLFIEAAGLLRKARPDLAMRIYVVGGPIYETVGSQVRASELLAQARIAGVESCFGLVPFQEDIARVYRALNVVVHASTEPEPFGRTIIEAMACARPVIVARAGGAAELFDDGVNALGVEPRNPAKLADAMIVALDPLIRARLGQAASAHARAGFGRSRLAPELLRVYSNA
jgi:glycosyltransferase involved in cell wall biosynthesis